MKELVRTTRALDPTRLVAAALERHEPRPGTQRIDDPLGSALDVLGCNEYLGWYDGLPDKADGVSWESAYDKPVVMSEFGADALQGLHGDALTRWTEEYQASVYDHQLPMLGRIPFLRGMSPSVLADFRSPRRPLPGIQDFWNRKGLISDHGIKKAGVLRLATRVRAHRAAKDAALPPTAAAARDDRQNHALSVWFKLRSTRLDSPLSTRCHSANSPRSVTCSLTAYPIPGTTSHSTVETSS